MPSQQAISASSSAARARRKNSAHTADQPVLARWQTESDLSSRLARVRHRLSLQLREHREAIRSWLVSLAIHLVILLSIGFIVWMPMHRNSTLLAVIDAELGEVGSETGFEDGFDRVGKGLEIAGGIPDWGEREGDKRFAPGDLGNSNQFNGIGIARPDQIPASINPAADEDEDDAPVPTPSKKGKGTKGGTVTKKAGGKGGGQDQGADVAGLLNGRGPAARARLVKKGGGTKETERAVELGLDWLARHQQADGSWSFQHGPDEPGMYVSPQGATGFALLAFLGAGNTPTKGRYASRVERGLNYLVHSYVETDNGAWFQGTGLGTMYVQAICTIALCEAYTMTKDPALRHVAQRAVDFIVSAQDREGGGWRYQIPQAGDTSVVGWQIMALTSARIAELSVHQRVLPKAGGFLQRVQQSSTGMYGYTGPNNPRESTTAVGVLSRIYLGREQSNRILARGIGRLSDWGPRTFDRYYCYYGTMAMHHWGGPQWEAWNNTMRKELVEMQEQFGDAAGSWPVDQSIHAHTGGRLYTTCLSILTLEVYYRYLPVYRKQEVDTDEPNERDEKKEP